MDTYTIIPSKAINTDSIAFLINSFWTIFDTTPIFTFASYLSSKYLFTSFTLSPSSVVFSLTLVSLSDFVIVPFFSPNSFKSFFKSSLLIFLSLTIEIEVPDL